MRPRIVIAKEAFEKGRHCCEDQRIKIKKDWKTVESGLRR